MGDVLFINAQYAGSNNGVTGFLYLAGILVKNLADGGVGIAVFHGNCTQRFGKRFVSDFIIKPLG